jgi:hypothetical protein
MIHFLWPAQNAAAIHCTPHSQPAVGAGAVNIRVIIMLIHCVHRDTTHFSV